MSDGGAAQDVPGSMVDWDLAVNTARRLARPGPEVTLTEAEAAVRELRELAEVATGHVRQITRMDAPAETPPTRVVDRHDWVAANVKGLENLLTPLVTELAAKRPPGRIASTIGPRMTGLQAGAVLAFLSSKVLGQFEIFAAEGGTLLLVAPNIVEAERSLGVDPTDFRLWVCLHEVTHRVQFTAVPWLSGYLHGQVAKLVEHTDLDPDALRERLWTALKEVLGAVKGQHEQGQGLLALVQTPAQREILDRITAFMSLVEGHAEYVMDAADASVIPSLPVIRERFQQRRRGSGPLDRLIRKLLGMDLKMRQYSDGSRFVRGVVDAVGMDGFNVVWTDADTLPKKAELAAPQDWVYRIHGIRPAESA